MTAVITNEANETCGARDALTPHCWWWQFNSNFGVRRSEMLAAKPHVRVISISLFPHQEHLAVAVREFLTRTHWDMGEGEGRGFNPACSRDHELLETARYPATASYHCSFAPYIGRQRACPHPCFVDTLLLSFVTHTAYRTASLRSRNIRDDDYKSSRNVGHEI